MTSISSSSSSSLSQMLMQQMQKARAEMFSKADTDASGGLSLSEFTAMGADNPNATQDSKAIQSMFTKLDTDGDGSLTQAELDAGAPPQQDIGMLSDKVLSALLDILGGDESSEETTETADASAASAPPPPPPPASSDSSTTEIFDALDTNKDGVVSLDEMMAGLSSTTTDTASTDGNVTSEDSDKKSIIAELKTAVKSFLISLQEQQQKQVA